MNRFFIVGIAIICQFIGGCSCFAQSTNHPGVIGSFSFNTNRPGISNQFFVRGTNAPGISNRLSAFNTNSPLHNTNFTGRISHAPTRIFTIAATTNVAFSNTNILVSLDDFTNYAAQFYYNPNWSYTATDTSSLTGGAFTNSNGFFVADDDTGGYGLGTLNSFANPPTEGYNIDYPNYIGNWSAGGGGFEYFPGFTNITYTTNYF